MYVVGKGKSFRFRPSTPPVTWKGRYSRIEGKTTTFKVIYTSEYGFWPALKWYKKEGRIFCHAVKCDEVEKLVEAINEAKSRLSGSMGGSFVINEHGQVIVPSAFGDGSRLLVGEIEGVLLFEDDNGEIIDLSDDSNLEVGEPWLKPYIGMQYNLSIHSRIYYFDNEKGSDYLPVQDENLIRKIRKVRRSGAVRFIVNPYGLVLTKIPEGEFSMGEDRWEPVYVGRINRDLWFRKES